MSMQSSSGREGLEIQIGGQKVPLRAISQVAPERAKEIIDLVTRRIREVEGRQKQPVATHQILVLAMLDLANEYLSARDRAAAHGKELEDRAAELLSLVEEQLPPGQA